MSLQSILTPQPPLPMPDCEKKLCYFTICQHTMILNQNFNLLSKKRRQTFTVQTIDSYREVAFIVSLQIVVLGLNLSGQLLLLSDRTGDSLLIGFLQSVSKLLFLGQDLCHGLGLSTKDRFHLTHISQFINLMIFKPTYTEWPKKKEIAVIITLILWQTLLVRITISVTENRCQKSA